MKKMKNKIIKSVFTVLMITLFASCESTDETIINYVSFEANQYSFGILPNTEQTRTINVYSTQISSVDRVLNLKINTINTDLDESAYFVPATVTIPANTNVGSFELKITDVNSETIGKFLDIEFSGLEEGLYSNTNILVEVEYFCLYNKVRLELILDRYGSETSWNITKNSVVVASGGPYSDIATNALQPQLDFIMCLEDGDYVINVYDAYGDGLFTSTSVQGSYKLLKIDGTILAQGSGNFGSLSTVNFTL